MVGKLIDLIECEVDRRPVRINGIGPGSGLKNRHVPSLDSNFPMG